MRPALLAAVLLVLGAGAVAVVLASGGSDGRGADERGPNLWVDRDGGGCVRRAAPAPYVDGEACSLDDAYRRARSRDVVHIREGRYPQAEIGPDNEDLEQPVTMRPDKGAKVMIAGLVTTGSRLTLRDVTIATEGRHRRGWISQDASQVRLDGVDITGPWANLRVEGGEGNAYVNASYGTAGNTEPRVCGKGDGEPVELTRTKGMTISNVDFQPFMPDRDNPLCGPDDVQHLETIRVNEGVDDLLLERSRFHRGDGSGTARLFVTKLEPAGTGENSNRIRVVNNWFGDAEGSTSILLGGNQVCAGYVFAYNLWEDGFDDACRKDGPDSLTFVGNEGTQPAYLPCPGTTASHNMWTWSEGRSDCGTDQWAIDPCNCLDGLALADDGFHVTSASPAVDAGQPEAECKRLTGGVDIDGEPRRGTCDAGPDELATER
ncbi:MAG: hypothetical protein ABW060_10845 [Solirubrobacteraceae bacterium]